MSAPAWVAVALFGGAAATARFLIDSAFASRVDHPFPLGILAVNLTGTLVLGLIAGAALSGEALAIVAGGVLGSFTTFSAWMLDSQRLADAGHMRLVWLNLGLSLVAGFAAVALGHWLGAAL
ncbi:MAG TPA: fluoride efflux transporter CrcB [Solirubrobacterales bacterium]|nr:fluoride efflux transporter CrcB [Solirubrobacterales bacterium]